MSNTPELVEEQRGPVLWLTIQREERRNAITDSRAIRTQALAARVTYYTTIAGARAAVEGMQYLREGLGIKVYSLQELHQSLAN